MVILLNICLLLYLLYQPHACHGFVEAFVATFGIFSFMFVTTYMVELVYLVVLNITIWNYFNVVP